MKKTALWGYGYYGRRIAAWLRLYKSSSYSLTMIFDRAYEQIRGQTDTEVYDPADIVTYYRQGCFETVVIGVYDEQEAAKLLQYLQENGIPAEEESFRPAFASIREFEQKPYKLTEEGYRGHILSDVFLERVLYLPTGYIFDSRMKIVRDFFRPYVFIQAPYVNDYCPDADKPVTELTGDWCFLAEIYALNYWHFLYEVSDRIAVMEASGYTGKYILPHTSFAEAVLRTFFDPRERVQWIEELDTERIYHFEKLHCIFCTSEKQRGRVLAGTAAQRIAQLPQTDRQYPKKIYVKRIGRRKLLTEDTFFTKRGYTVVIPEELTPEEQIRYFYHADIVVTPHGANSANCIYMRPGTVLAETFPQNYINPCCLSVLQAKNIHYLMAAETETGEDYDPQDHERDYRVQPALLDMTLREAEILAGCTETGEQE